MKWHPVTRRAISISGRPYVLADFKARREAGRSRVEYVERLVSDLATYYGYNHWLVQYFLDTFSVAETMVGRSYIPARCHPKRAPTCHEQRAISWASSQACSFT
jgi:hypothetical protein